MEPGGTAWAESVDGIRWIPLVQPEGTPWAESADRIRAIPPVEAGVRGLPPVEAGGGWDSIPASGGVARAASWGNKECDNDVLSIGRSSETAGKTTFRRKGTNQNTLEIAGRP